MRFRGESDLNIWYLVSTTKSTSIPIVFYKKWGGDTGGVDGRWLPKGAGEGQSRVEIGGRE